MNDICTVCNKRHGSDLPMTIITSVFKDADDPKNISMDVDLYSDGSAELSIETADDGPNGEGSWNGIRLNPEAVNELRRILISAVVK